MTSNGKATIKTIANELKLSLSTVSRVLNNTSEKHRISKATQELVLKKAKQMGYIPNMAAKTLRLNQSKTIGLLLPSLNNPFFSYIASSVSQAFYKRGYVVLMSDCNGNSSEEKNILEALLAQNLLGILIIPSGEKETFEILKNYSIPSVFMDRYFEDFDNYYVATDHYQSAAKLMDHLITNGHTNIACIQGDKAATSNKLRVDAYLDKIKENKLQNPIVAGSSFTTEDGYLEAKKLLGMKNCPTAILTLSDTILLGCVKAIKESGKRIPEDISVVSIDNSSYLDFLEFPITSVSQPIRRITQLAIKILLELITNPEELSVKRKEKAILLDSSVIFRNSVKKLN